MKSKQELIQGLANYKTTLQKPNAPIVENFGKMYHYLVHLKKQEIPTELWLVLVLECIREALTTAKRANIRFKDFSRNWSKDTVDKTVKHVSNIKSQLSEGDSNAYKVNMYRLFTLLFEEEGDPSTILYCWSLYDKIEDGNAFIRSGKDKFKQLLAASSDEEIDNILNPKQA